MRSVLLLAALALVHAQRIARHDDHGGHEDEPDPHSHAISAVWAATELETPALVSSGLPTPSSAVSTGHGHGHGHGAPPAHNHNSHAPVKEFLDDAALHEWHDFPPTYMDADFRLTPDKVIFGEVFPADWDAATVASHPGLMFAHVACMVIAYFVLIRPRPPCSGAPRALHRERGVVGCRCARVVRGRRVQGCDAWIRRTQVVLAYVAVCTGIPVYVGMCRAGFINTCAAHIIKGSIFFGYGVLTFARYLGAYADLGWAWNRKPAGSRAVSAEMVECAVIFTYGATNTWMERFGSKAGDPYTVKQVQHISIAVMFAFGGLAGCLLESVRVRKLLGSVISTNSDNGRVQEPPTYAFSFNPFPALVIAITGLAMAAHHQDYVFQVQIHSLWGILLAGGSLFRFLTYCYLWLRPPTDSMLPSRPPTEVLTSFGWAAGGIVFMLSDEEVAFAAMRSGFDDVMAFLNFTVALTCLVFCWIVVVMAVKGFSLVRMKRGVELAVGDEEATAA